MAVEALIHLLQDKSPKVRRNAALALGRTGDPAGVEPLIQAVQDSDAEVANAAADALWVASGYKHRFGRDAAAWKDWWEEHEREVVEAYKRKMKQEDKEEEKARLDEEGPTGERQSGAAAWLFILILIAVGPVAALVAIRVMLSRH